jgi:hypothetical protein
MPANICERADGAQGRNRTTDTVIFSHVLYQLSYLGTGMSARLIVAMRVVCPGVLRGGSPPGAHARPSKTATPKESHTREKPRKGESRARRANRAVRGGGSHDSPAGLRNSPLPSSSLSSVTAMA